MMGVVADPEEITPDLSHRCVDCGCLFSTRAYLQGHWKRMHLRKKGRHQCRFCSYSCSRTNGLVRHERTHTGERPFVCDTCGKTFAVKVNLVLHQRMHAGERPYPCEVCGQRFTYSSHLTRHRRTHTGDCPYICSVCGKAFNQKGNLDAHTMTHTRAFLH